MRTARKKKFKKRGGLAQLGERLPYKQNVGSSILSSPTKAKSSLSGCFLHIKDKNSIFLY